MTGHVTGTANTVVQKNVFGMGVWSLATIGQGKTPQDGGEEGVRIIDTWLNTEVWPINPTTIIKDYNNNNNNRFIKQQVINTV